MSELLDGDWVIEQFAFIQSSREKRALKLLRRPIRLRPGQNVELTHPDYRGPWHLHHKPDKQKIRSLIRERIGGPTPTRFVIISPDSRGDFERDQKGILPPYRGKPVILKGTSGIFLSIELTDTPDDKNNASSLVLKNHGRPLTASGALKTGTLEPFSPSFLSDYESMLIALPEGHTAHLRTEDGLTISLQGITQEKFTLSFTGSSRRVEEGEVVE